MMRNIKNPSLRRVMWWSIRLGWSRNKVVRRRMRKEICSSLSQRWRTYAPDSPPGVELAIVRAVWLGATLASRSLARYPLLPRPLKRRLMWTRRILGKTSGKAVIAAYLAWTWLKEAAISSMVESAQGWNRTSS